jgi:DNA-binding transcriptional ArsR family regulator
VKDAGIPTYTIEHGDGPNCLLSFGEVDHVFVDVPYSAEVDARNEAEQLRDNPFEFDPMTDDLRERTARAVAARCRRWALIMTSDDEVDLWKKALTRAGMDVLRIGHWVRQGTKPQITGDRPAQGTEPIVIAHSRIGERRWNGGGRPGVWFAPIVQGTARVHPTQKPEQLLRQLIDDFSDEGEIWADIFAGSFSTGVVALGMGRRFYGVELDEKWIALGHERMKLPLFQSKPLQADLFGASPASRSAKLREDLDRQILRLISNDGIARTEIASSIDATRSEITRALARLRKSGLVRRDGKTNDSKYFRAVAMQGGVHLSTGDQQP